MIGLTGPNASGKGEVAKFLTAHGFAVHSLSDVVREEATRQGLDHTRDNLIATGVRLRTEAGSGALARCILPRLRGREVVDSIRNPGEVAVLRTLPRFLLLGVDAPQPVRFERSGQQLLATLALADLVVDNDATLEDLHHRVREALTRAGVVL